MNEMYFRGFRGDGVSDGRIGQKALLTTRFTEGLEELNIMFAIIFLFSDK
jgi:hypothetical protein